MTDAWHATERRFDPSTLPALLAAGYRSSIDDPDRVTVLPSGVAPSHRRSTTATHDARRWTTSRSTPTPARFASRPACPSTPAVSARAWRPISRWRMHSDSRCRRRAGQYRRRPLDGGPPARRRLDGRHRAPRARTRHPRHARRPRRRRGHIEHPITTLAALDGRERHHVIDPWTGCALDDRSLVGHGRRPVGMAGRSARHRRDPRRELAR